MWDLIVSVVDHCLSFFLVKVPIWPFARPYVPNKFCPVSGKGCTIVVSYEKRMCRLLKNNSGNLNVNVEVQGYYKFMF